MSNVAVRQEDLDGYAAYAAKYNEVTKPTFKKLQLLNKEGRDGFGKWFIGRKFEGREVVEQGEEVAAIVVIDHYGQYSLYDKDTNKNVCRCDLFHGPYSNGTKGKPLGFECGPNCPNRQGKKKACNAQRVVFCMAITRSGNKIPCVYYAKGSGFMPFVEYMNKAVTQIIGGKLIELPMFAFTTELGSREEVNGDTIYNVPIFKFGQLVPMDKMPEFALLADQVQNYVKTNATVADEHANEEEDAAPRIPTATAGPATVTPIRKDMDTMDEAPWGGDTVTPTITGGEDTDDLAASISKALGL